MATGGIAHPERASERERESATPVIEWWWHWQREPSRSSLGQICTVVKGYWADCGLGFLLLPTFSSFSFFFAFFFLK
jgi:hypothetical protein